MAKKIVERLAFEPGETFLIVAHPGLFEEIVPYLRYEAMKAGAVDLGVMEVMAAPVPSAWSQVALEEGGKRARPELRKMLEGVDAAIMMPGATPAQPVYAAMQDRLKAGQRTDRSFPLGGERKRLPSSRATSSRRATSSMACISELSSRLITARSPLPSALSRRRCALARCGSRHPKEPISAFASGTGR